MNAARHLLIVDGDAPSRAELGRDMVRLGFTVATAANAADAAALVMFRAARIDLMLVQTDLPDGDGRELVARLRRRGVMVPVMLLSDSGSEDDVVRGLDAGADDYLVRPLRRRELAARIRAQFRVSAGREETDIQVGVLTFRPGSRTVFHPFLPRPVRLTEKEATLLTRLCRADGRAVSRQTLLREVWGYSPNVSSHTVETHIYRLRRKLRSGPHAPAMVLNEDGGYRLASVESSAPEPVAIAARPGWSMQAAVASRLAVAEAR